MLIMIPIATSEISSWFSAADRNAPQLAPFDPALMSPAQQRAHPLYAEVLSLAQEESMRGVGMDAIERCYGKTVLSDALRRGGAE